MTSTAPRVVRDEMPRGLPDSKSIFYPLPTFLLDLWHILCANGADLREYFQRCGAIDPQHPALYSGNQALRFIDFCKDAYSKKTIAFNSLHYQIEVNTDLNNFCDLISMYRNG